MAMFLSCNPVEDTTSTSFLLRNFFTAFSLPFYLLCLYNPHVVSNFHVIVRTKFILVPSGGLSKSLFSVILMLLPIYSICDIDKT